MYGADDFEAMCGRSTSGWFLLNLTDPQALHDRIELLAMEAVPDGHKEEIYY